MNKENFRSFAKDIAVIASEIEALMNRNEIKGYTHLVVGENGYVNMNVSDCEDTLTRLNSARAFEIDSREKI